MRFVWDTTKARENLRRHRVDFADAMIALDAEIIEHFKQLVHEAGGGNYQTLINEVLREQIRGSEPSLEKRLRRIIREELKQAS